MKTLLLIAFLTFSLNANANQQDKELNQAIELMLNAFEYLPMSYCARDESMGERTIGYGQCIANLFWETKEPSRGKIKNMLWNRAIFKRTFETFKPAIQIALNSSSCETITYFKKIVSDSLNYIDTFDYKAEKEKAKDGKFLYIRGYVNSFIYRRYSDFMNGKASGMKLEESKWWLQQFRTLLDKAETSSQICRVIQTQRDMGFSKLTKLFSDNTYFERERICSSIAVNVTNTKDETDKYINKNATSRPLFEILISTAQRFGQPITWNPVVYDIDKREGKQFVGLGCFPKDLESSNYKTQPSNRYVTSIELNDNGDIIFTTNEQFAAKAPSSYYSSYYIVSGTDTVKMSQILVNLLASYFKKDECPITLPDNTKSFFKEENYYLFGQAHDVYAFDIEEAENIKAVCSK